MSHDKQDRAPIIISKVLELDQEHGCSIPSRGAAATHMARLIQTEPKWRAFVTADQRITLAPLTQYNLGERRLIEPGWQLFELEVHNQPKLIANLRGSEIRLYWYQPGLWENWFGVDNGGDTVTLDPWIFADPKSAEWQALQQGSDCRLPPLREVGREDELALRHPRRKTSRGKQRR